MLHSEPYHPVVQMLQSLPDHLASQAQVALRDVHPSPVIEPCSSHDVQLEVHVTPYIPAPHNGHGGVTKLVGGVAWLLPLLPQHTTELLEATMPQECKAV